ncbi:MAG: barstar family protein [Actinobacteria bacterium]|nr:barstar family protein [Actinomycetota bacterium]
MTPARPHVRGELSWITSGPAYCVEVSALEVLEEFLDAHGYTVVALDGEQMTTRATTFDELRRAFALAPWCGDNWDAVNDCLGEFVHAHDGQLVAIVWCNQDVAAANAPATSAEVGWALLEVVLGRMPSLGPNCPWRIHADLFLTGQGEDYDRPPPKRLPLPGPVECPVCGEMEGVPILRGLPMPVVQEAAREHRAVLRGCIVSPEDDNWFCRACAWEWR